MTKLGDDMIARADADNLPEQHKMRVLARLLNIAADDYYAEPQRIAVNQFVGHWARARRCWTEYTGEPII